MSKELPSIDDFADKNNLPSIDDFLTEDVIEALPSVKDFIEEEKDQIEDLLEEVNLELPSIEDFIDKEEDLLEESVNIFDGFDGTQIVGESEENGGDSEEDLIDTIKELISDVRKDIPNIPEIKYYDDELEKICEIIDQVRLQIPEEIDRLEKNIEIFKNQIPTLPDLSWIDEDLINLSDKIETLRERIEIDINSLIEDTEVKFFENKVDKNEIRSNIQKLDEKYQKEKNDIWDEIKQSSIKIYEYHKEFKDDDRKLKKQITNEYNILKQNLEEKITLFNENSVNTDKVLLNYFETLKEEISGLPKVKYYDEDLKNVTNEIKDLYNLVETIKIEQKNLNENLLKEPSQEKQSIGNTPDPLTPMDQKFATLDDLANHYRIFINRIQTQLSTIGGGGAGFIKDLDDVSFDQNTGNGKLLIYNGSKWVGIASTALSTGGGSGGGGEDLNATLSLGNTSSLGMSVGVVTSTGFVGNLSGNSSTATYAATSGISTYSTSSGISTVSTGLTGTPDIQIGNITGFNATFTGNVSIAGTLTYEDVTNVDSIGIVTARNGSIIKAGTATTALIVEGNTRIIGILTVGSSSITIDGSNNQVNVGSGVTIHHTNGVQVGGNTLHSSGLTINQLNVSGIITASSFKGNLTGTATTSTYAVSAGVATYAENTGVSTYSNVAGISTYATSSGIATYSNISGLSTYASTAGVSTASQGLTGTPDIKVGLTTSTRLIVDPVGSGTTFPEDLVVEGNTRITGILTVGTSSIVLDGDINQVNVGSGVTLHHTNGVQVGGNTVHSSGLTINQLNVSGVTTSSSYSLPDGLISSGSQTITTTLETSIDSFSSTTYRSAKYQIQITKGSEYQITEVFVVHDGTSSYQTEYATVKTGTTLSTFSSDIDTGSVSLLATPSSSDSTTFKIIRTLVKI